MAHRSWCAEHLGTHSNERLEFLGDAVLGWVVADLVYASFPTMTEGQLSELRKAVVNADALADTARSIDLGSFVLLGRGEVLGGGADKTSILSDALEAVIGSVYLDGGPVAAQAVVRGLLAERVVAAAQALGRQDAKTQLQELLARRGLPGPSYVVTSSGPDHARRFHAVVRVAGEPQGDGQGTSKKLAEQAAAHSALDRLRPEAEPHDA